MKKFFLALVLALSAISVNAQFYGAFYEADPDAWIDKEPYFACQNMYVYNGWGQNLQSVMAVINESDVYSFPDVWVYGKFIVIDRNCGVDFSSGDRVSLYVGEQCIGTWTYKPSSALSGKKFRLGKGGGQILKSIWKYVKKIR